jgi:SAM-dependent methyltransferase
VSDTVALAAPGLLTASRWVAPAREVTHDEHHRRGLGVDDEWSRPADRRAATKCQIGCGKGTKLSERSGTLADDPFGGRRATSHEQLTGLPWNASYQDGPAPWDVGQPQPAVVRLASEGGFAGPVLDAGCGTGENALHVASRGLSVLGVDVAETALAIARAKADDRGIRVEFTTADAFQLERLERTFATVLDCGLFHTFDGDERPRYVASVASVTEHDGTLYVLCFSDDGPDIGPHPVSQKELRAAFDPSNGWNVAAIEPDRLQTRFHDDGAPAWLATIERI